MNKEELTGKKFGNLIVVKEHGRDKWGKVLWLCECQCENKTKKIINTSLLKSGQTTNCGCLKRERAKYLNYKHGYKKKYPQIYDAWQNMKARCNNPKYEFFHHYGGRGITYDPKWESIEGFIDDMLEGWSEGLTLDRIDVNGNYNRDNCRWADMRTQANNRRSNRYIEINGEIKQLSDWSRSSGIAESTIFGRYERGIRGDDLLIKNSRPVSEKQSGITGIIWNKRYQKWMVNQNINGKKKCLGFFEDVELAQRCLDEFKQIRELGKEISYF